MISSKITGTGTFIPSIKKENSHFLNDEFLNADGSTFSSDNDVIVEKFKEITGISERRYAKAKYTTSDLAFFASQKAIEDAKRTGDEVVESSDTHYIIKSEGRKGSFEYDCVYFFGHNGVWFSIKAFVWYGNTLSKVSEYQITQAVLVASSAVSACNHLPFSPNLSP